MRGGGGGVRAVIKGQLIADLIDRTGFDSKNAKILGEGGN